MASFKQGYVRLFGFMPIPYYFTSLPFMYKFYSYLIPSYLEICKKPYIHELGEIIFKMSSITSIDCKSEKVDFLYNS